MTRIQLSTTISIISLAVIWPFVAILLAAYQVIPGNTERWTSWLCLAVALFGAMYLSATLLAKPTKPIKIILAIIIPFCAATAVFQARKHSDQMFAFWIMNRVSPAEWQEMASTIDGISRKAASKGDWSVALGDLPRELPALGEVESCWGITHIRDFGDGRLGARLTFGDRNRRWGLLVGPEEFMGFFGKFRQIPVATNAQFFFGPDW